MPSRLCFLKFTCLLGLLVFCLTLEGYLQRQDRQKPETETIPFSGMTSNGNVVDARYIYRGKSNVHKYHMISASSISLVLLIQYQTNFGRRIHLSLTRETLRVRETTTETISNREYVPKLGCYDVMITIRSPKTTLSNTILSAYQVVCLSDSVFTYLQSIQYIHVQTNSEKKSRQMSRKRIL